MSPFEVRLKSVCCPFIERTTNGQQTDNKRTTNGQQTEEEYSYSIVRVWQEYGRTIVMYNLIIGLKNENKKSERNDCCW